MAPNGNSGDAKEEIRIATRDDVPAIFRMIKELLTSLIGTSESSLTIEDVYRDGFDTQPPWFFTVLAEVDGEAVGYVQCYRGFSIYTGRTYLPSGVYVREEYRRHGIAQKLIKTVAQIALSEGVHRIDGSVKADNNPAIALYERAGAIKPERVLLQLEKDGLEKIANMSEMTSNGNSGGAQEVIRIATREDVPAIFRMIKGLLASLNGTSESSLTIEDVYRDGFDKQPTWFFTVLAEVDGEAAGYMQCFRGLSVYTGRIYLTSGVYVREDYQRHSIGQKLIQAVAQMAIKEGVHRLDGNVRTNNDLSIDLFERAGADKPRRVTLRLEKDALERIANL